MASKKSKKLPAPPTGLGAAALGPLQTAAPIKGVDPSSLPLPAPPPGTYNSILDYNAAAAGRGYTQTLNDAQTLYEQGQEDYGLGRGDLTRGRDRNLQDLTTSKDYALADYGRATQDLGRQYGILGRQQAEGAAQRGVTSPGLLGESSRVRAVNQERDQGVLNTGRDRALTAFNTGSVRNQQDYERSLLGLDLGNARQFGGYNGNIINNPLTGRPYTGSLATGVQRAFTENDAYQTGILGQKIEGARANGYVSPLLHPPGLSNPLVDDDYLANARRVQGILQGRR